MFNLFWQILRRHRRQVVCDTIFLFLNIVRWMVKMCCMDNCRSRLKHCMALCSGADAPASPNRDGERREVWEDNKGSFLRGTANWQEVPKVTSSLYVQLQRGRSTSRCGTASTTILTQETHFSPRTEEKRRLAAGDRRAQRDENNTAIVAITIVTPI